MFFTWLNPGPASGYMFVVANTTAIVLILLLAIIIGGGLGVIPIWVYLTR